MPYTNSRNAGPVSLAYKREYLRLARDVLHFYENCDDYAHRVAAPKEKTSQPPRWRSVLHERAARHLQIQNDQGNHKGIVVAINHTKEQMLWPNILIAIPTVAVWAAGALSAGPLAVPIWMVAGLFTTGTVLGFRKYQQRKEILREIHHDFKAKREDAFYSHLDKLSQELRKQPIPRVHRFFEQVEDTLSYAARVKANQPTSCQDFLLLQENLRGAPSPQASGHDPQMNLPPPKVCQSFLQVARRMAHIAQHGSERAPDIARTEVLRFAAKATRMEQYARMNLWPRLMLNAISKRKPHEDIATEFAAVPLAKEWFEQACTGSGKVHGFMAAYNGLEQRLQRALHQN